VKRALIVCPGRGSYERASLGSLKDRSADATAIVARCDEWRADHGRPTISELDALPTYQGSKHVAGEHASLLTFAAAMADLADLARDRYDVVGVVGNSMGFYTALAASGALSLDDAIRLVDTMGSYQEGNVIGGQVITPMADHAAIDAALGSDAWWSIRLGSYAVIGATDDGCKRLLEVLPTHETGSRAFPARLPLHSAFHTPLMAETSLRAKADLADLGFQAPKVPLVDGRGVIFRPRWADPAELWEYTLGAQVVDTYDFTTSVRTALRHTGADVVVALGPGNSLGAPLASILQAEGWAGAHGKAAFDERQAQDPLLLAFGVSKQREFLA
jgi:[acyl-carrier-protein] S-malonyltransferase